MTYALISASLISCLLSVAAVLDTPKTEKERIEEDVVQIRYIGAWRDRKQKKTGTN